MTKVIITRHYSGFCNVEDTYLIGNHEHHGRAYAAEFDLPAGYTVHNNRIYDAAGIECAIVPDGDAPLLISRTGNCPDQRLTVAA